MSNNDKLKRYLEQNVHHHMTSGVYSVTSVQGNRPYMEDRYVVATVPGALCAFVFDGHGGGQVSQWLTNHFPIYLFEAVYRQPSIAPNVIKSIIQQTILDLDEKLIFQKQFKSGSTITGFLLYEGYIYIINLGDSRTMVVGKQSNQLVFVTEDHVPTSTRELNRIQSIQSYVSHPQHGSQDVPRLEGQFSLTRAMGDPGLKVDKRTRSIYLGQMAPMSPWADVTAISTSDNVDGVKISMASDGLFEGSLVDNLTMHKSLASLNGIGDQNLINRLVNIALVKSNDNITLMVINVNNSAPGWK